jgi:hypothetical protein
MTEHGHPPDVSLPDGTVCLKTKKAVGFHGLAQRHPDVTRKKAVGVAIAHGLV